MLIVLKLLGSIALLIFGMKMMSEALQKMAGPQLRHLLGAMTTNRFTGVATGALVTVAVQSSAATTVMTVSFVNAALLTLTQAISIIMGANIGTTMSAWIMSAGFSFNVVNVVWPAFLIGIILIQIGKHRYFGDFLFGLSFLLFALGMLKQTGVEMDLASKPEVVAFFSSFKTNYGTILLFLLIGTILTAMVQSSAALMAITMVLCATGAISIFQGIALVMGENIGTTVTSNLAALTASTQARRAAFAHMFFNLFGVFWMLIVFRPFINFVCGLVGYDVTMQKEIVGTEAFMANAAKLSFVLAAFHTCFNLVNTGILIWFIPQIEKIVCFVIRDRKGKTEDDDTVRLEYIDSGLMRTPELSVLQAQREIGNFASRMQRMFGMVQSLLDEKKTEEAVKLFSRIEKYEGISDRMEIEIARYLEQVSDRHLSDETKAHIRAMMREVSELESIGDACFNMGRTMNRLLAQQEQFDEGQHANIISMMALCEQALARMAQVLDGEKDSEPTMRLEADINNLRNRLKRENIAAVNDHRYSYSLGTAYIDLISECEKLGDYVVNVVEARLGEK